MQIGSDPRLALMIFQIALIPEPYSHGAKSWQPESKQSASDGCQRSGTGLAG